MRPQRKLSTLRDSTEVKPAVRCTSYKLDKDKKLVITEYPYPKKGTYDRRYRSGLSDEEQIKRFNLSCIIDDGDDYTPYLDTD